MAKKLYTRLEEHSVFQAKLNCYVQSLRLLSSQSHVNFNVEFNALYCFLANKE